MYLDYLSNNLGEVGDKSRLMLWDLEYTYNIFFLRRGFESPSSLIKEEHLIRKEYLIKKEKNNW